MTKFRRSWNGKLILQIKDLYLEKDDYPSLEYKPKETWRDATFEDYQKIMIVNQMIDEDEDEQKEPVMGFGK